MLMTIDPAAAAPASRAQQPLAAGVPRITPIRDLVDKRYSDLSFSIDTGGRPSYRVLIARDRALFAPEQAGARNASNFYDSQREGLQQNDGPPCFYLVPRSVLHAMLPAQRLYYTVIAYEDSDGTRATYAHAPEALATAAPSVNIADELSASLSLMFGTPVNRLLPVGRSAGLAFAADEDGEDVSAELPESIGLAADDGHADADHEVGEAAASDADGDEGYGEPYGDEGLEQAAALDAEDDADDDRHGASASLAAEAGWRTPMFEDAEAAAAFDEGNGDAADVDTGLGAADADYDDGYGAPAQAGVRAYETQAEDDEPGYGAEHETAQSCAGGYDDEVHAFDAPSRQPVPEMLPDEDADGAHAAQARQYEDDEVEIEPPPGQAQAHASAYGDDYSDDDDDGHGESYADAASDAPNVAAPPAATRAPFDIEACKAILARIMPFESGKEGFARIVDDGEFAGRFGTGHPAYQRYHLGLTFGAFPFVQEHGTLGQLLALMRERDRATFDSLFPEAQALLRVTNASDGPRAWESPDGMSPRLRPVGGQPLWEEPWVGRFRRAGQHPPFQGAQNELAARLYVHPVLQVARQIGLESEQGLTLLIDRAVQMGAPAALAWALEAATPVETPALRQQALASLGHADLAAFQRAAQVPLTGIWDVATHAALIAALRASPRSPTPVLSGNEIVAAMLRHAQGLPWAERMARLRDATSATRLFQF